MGRYIGPQIRHDRRFGVVVSGKASAPKILARARGKQWEAQRRR